MPAIDSAWSSYRNQLLSFIESRVASKDDAEDILNDVFIKLIKQQQNNRMPDNIIGWLYRVTRHSIVDYYRGRNKFEELSHDLAAEYPEPEVIAQLSRCILPMIQVLPENFKQAILLTDIEGKTQREAADELGLTLPAIKSRILRGREHLHKLLRQCCVIDRDSDGNIIDFKQKENRFCDDCES